MTLRREGNALIVRVVENPVINRIAFEGNKKLKDETLLSEIQLKPRTVYTRQKVQSDVARLLDLYRRNGRFAATVEPKIVQLPQNRVDLVFEINEGDFTGVKSISFIGNRHFSSNKLARRDRHQGIALVAVPQPRPTPTIPTASAMTANCCASSTSPRVTPISVCCRRWRS